MLSLSTAPAPAPPVGQAKYTPVDLNTSSLKMYWGVAKQFGGQELWRELLGVMKKVRGCCGAAVVLWGWAGPAWHAVPAP
jgi:hypothetical protein